MKSNRKGAIIKLSVKGKVFYSAESFMSLNGLKTRKSLSDWIKSGKAEKYTIGRSVFYALT